MSYEIHHSYSVSNIIGFAIPLPSVCISPILTTAFPDRLLIAKHYACFPYQFLNAVFELFTEELTIHLGQIALNAKYSVLKFKG